ncbi:hypothetical protein V3429_02920 [Aeromonas jandaei]|uniref:hypothetical protein n=1 Tax=Aeromonas TaxID=642 RepID=UPI001C222EA0|nr:hypothetical protein [Aeromonas sp. FDAARGOS 1410]QXC37022.1 hypothetical protein I6L40_13955 [Aeromonas sp. FDAARGOS 1410]
MSEQKIDPNQVTKPIQLLAAWLVGLILINSTFLGAAKVITTPAWASGLLVVAAVVNVPIFLILIFFLQTKFRAELQEDTFYSKHLEKVTGNTKEKPNQNEIFLNQLKQLENNNDNKIKELSANIEAISQELAANKKPNVDMESIFKKLNDTRDTLTAFERQKIRSSTRIALNDLLPSYKLIAKKLISLGYSISTTFGSSNEDKNIPSCLTISYVDGLPKSSLKELYHLLSPLGFNRIDYDDDETARYEHIYIGSYIDEFPDARASVYIDKNIESAICDDNISMDELNELIIDARA